MSRHLHIVCLDVPWPPDYGGAIDMMNRIIFFQKQGVKIHLHYFSYNERGTPYELYRFCESIYVYERKTGTRGLSARLPYIVASRINEQLINNLQKDNHPILLEGIHCTGVLPAIADKRRKIVVRVHNDEAVYYRQLARAETSWLKKIFFLRESRKLFKYCFTLPAECIYACVSQKDANTLREQYCLPNVDLIPTFPSWQKVNSQEGMGTLCLYHGNLSVPENEEAAIWLLRKVFTQIRKPLVIAGKKPSKRLEKLVHLYQHACLVANPTDDELNDLIQKAHINVLPCFNQEETGIRLKLLHALFEGRHCVVNEAMVKGTGLEAACYIASTPRAFASVIAQLYFQPFTSQEIRLRENLLYHTYNNEKNVGLFMQYLW